jgi:hypothetical protein
MSFMVELWQFMREQKKFWLLPLFLIILAFGAVIVLAKGSALAPFLYAIF